jgi:glucose dehydrogenase
VPNRRRHSASLTRRALLSGAAGALATSAIANGDALRAQEQLPETPVPLGPTVPPEIAQATTGWPTAQGNLAGHRAAGDSAISAASLDRLEVAWRLLLTAEGGYGAVTATPIVIDDIVYLQDMDSNVLAIDRGSGAIRWRRDCEQPTAGGNGVAVGYGHVYGVSREPSPLAAARREQSSPPTATVAKSSGRRASGSAMRTETAPSCRRPRPRR